jgi:hypothetical protein
MRLFTIIIVMNQYLKNIGLPFGVQQNNIYKEQKFIVLWHTIAIM